MVNLTVEGAVNLMEAVAKQAAKDYCDSGSWLLKHGYGINGEYATAEQKYPVDKNGKPKTSPIVHRIHMQETCIKYWQTMLPKRWEKVKEHFDRMILLKEEPSKTHPYRKEMTE